MSQLIDLNDPEREAEIKARMQKIWDNVVSDQELTKYRPQVIPELNLIVFHCMDILKEYMLEVTSIVGLSPEMIGETMDEALSYLLGVAFMSGVKFGQSGRMLIRVAPSTPTDN
jgi:hypothetical protein